MPPTVQKKRFIDRLATQAGISHEHLMDASRRAAEAGESVERILVEEGLVGSGKVTQIAAEHLGLPAVSLANFTPDSDLLRCLPRRITTEMKVLPLAKWGSVFAFAVPDPFDMDVIDELRAAIDEKVVIYAAPRDEILSHLAQLSSEGPRGLEAALRDMPQGATEIEITEESSDDITEAEMLDLSEQEPVVRIVNSMLVDAVERGVSDVHIEPMAHTLHIRYRIDGVLYDQASPPKYMQWAIVSRIKIIAHMDIAQRRLPQDGRFSIHAGGRRVDVRVSTIPSVHGERLSCASWTSKP